jgi:uridylate kinase
MIDNQNKAIYKRILLKPSGEALLGKQNSGVDPEVANYITTEVESVTDLNVQIGIVLLVA